MWMRGASLENKLEGAGWTHLAQNIDQLGVLVNTTINLLVP
jgi:hypothetical protein